MTKIVPGHYILGASPVPGGDPKTPAPPASDALPDPTGEPYGVDPVSNADEEFRLWKALNFADRFRSRFTSLRDYTNSMIRRVIFSSPYKLSKTAPPPRDGLWGYADSLKEGLHRTIAASWWGGFGFGLWRGCGYGASPIWTLAMGPVTIYWWKS